MGRARGGLGGLAGMAMAMAMVTEVAGWGAPTRVRRGQARMSVIGDIQAALVKRYDVASVARVLDSLDGVAMGKEIAVEHEEHGGAKQEASSFIEGLTAKPWYDASGVKWCQRLEEHADVIARELKNALTDEGARTLEEEGTNVWVAAVEDAALAYGPDWKTLVLQDREWDESNCRLFPKTTAILRKVTADKEATIPCVEAFFARQTPGTGIKPHTDFCNFILTAHLGLDVPEGDCYIQVGNEKREWQNGKAMLFDTSFVHSTANNTDRDRFVLLLRVWHPELTKIEREALAFVFKATEDPSILEELSKPKKDVSSLSMKERKRLRQRTASPKKSKGFTSK